MENVFDQFVSDGRQMKTVGSRIEKKDHVSAPLSGAGSSDPIGKVEMLERSVIYGADLRTTSTPRITVTPESSPVVRFRSPSGEMFGISDKLLSMHLLLLGATGQGKSNAFYFIIDHLMQKMKEDPVKDSVMLIFDTKGDFYNRFYDPHNPNHIVIGNEAIYSSRSPVWSIFREAYDIDKGIPPVKTLEIRMKEIAAHLFRGRESETQPFFHLAAADLFVKFAVDYVMNKNELTTAALISARKKADAKSMKEMLERNPEFASAKSYLGDPEKQTAQALGILAFLNSMINDLFQGIFNENRPTGEVSMRELIHDGRGLTIFLEYDLSTGNVLDPMYSLLIDLALKEALTRQDDKRPHLYLVADEFKLLPDLQHIENALNYGRSKGIRVFAGVQSISQIYEAYGEDEGNSILSGFLNCFAFKTLDKKSREYTSERFGKNYSNINYRTDLNNHSVQREGYAVEDWNILDLDIGDAYIGLLGYPPFRFHFSLYDKE